MYSRTGHNKCVIPGCKARNKSVHKFPKDKTLREKWVKFVFGDHPMAMQNDCQLWLCTAHFSEDWIENRGIFESGFATKLLLKHGAVPSIRDPAVTIRPMSYSGTAASPQHPLPYFSAIPASSVLYSRTAASPPPPVPSFCAIPASSVSYSRTAASPPPPVPSFSTIPASSAPLDLDTRYIKPTNQLDESFLSESTSSSTPLTSDSDESLDQSSWHEEKAIVYQSKLLELFRLCQICGKGIVNKSVFYIGAQMIVKWECVNSHEGTWSSCPEVRGMAETHLVAAASLLFTGGTFTQLEEWSKLLNLRMVSKTAFYDIQNTYLHPVIKAEYQRQKDVIHSRIIKNQEAGKKTDLSGDTRSDCPGFNVKYSTYSVMLDDTKEIIQSNLVQDTETTSSVAMEAEGFKRAMTELLAKGLEVDVMTTDRSPSIRKIMREHYPLTKHQLDCWHTVKSVIKKVAAKAKKRGCSELADWLHTCSNHMWFSVAKCGGNTEELKCRWISILHHISNQHSWTENGEQRHCLHAPLTDDQSRRKKWLSRDSQAFKELSTIVQDNRLMKDLDQMGRSKHTSDLEVFHSTLLKYLPKSQYFSYVETKERTNLAILHHNENVGRKQARTARGALRWRRVWCKRLKKWVIRKLFQPCTTSFRKKLIQLALARRLDPSILYKLPQLPTFSAKLRFK